MDNIYSIICASPASFLSILILSVILCGALTLFIFTKLHPKHKDVITSVVEYSSKVAQILAIILTISFGAYALNIYDYKQLQSKVQELKSEKNELGLIITISNDILKNNQDAITKMSAEIDANRLTLENFKAETSNYEKTIENYKSEISAYKASSAQHQSTIESQKKDIARLDTSIKDLESSIKNREAKIYTNNFYATILSLTLKYITKHPEELALSTNQTTKNGSTNNINTTKVNELIKEAIEINHRNNKSWLMYANDMRQKMLIALNNIENEHTTSPNNTPNRGHQTEPKRGNTIYVKYHPNNISNEKTQAKSVDRNILFSEVIDYIDIYIKNCRLDLSS